MTTPCRPDTPPSLQISQAEPAALSPLGLGILVTGQLLTQLDFSIVNVALDRIGTTLATDATGLVLVVACYGVSFATLIGAGGRLGDRYGRKRLFLIGAAGFCLASLLCGQATGLLPMLAGRLLQGVFGALLMPQILATIHASLHGPRHSSAVGIYTAVPGSRSSSARCSAAGWSQPTCSGSAGGLASSSTCRSARSCWAAAFLPSPKRTGAAPQEPTPPA